MASTVFGMFSEFCFFSAFMQLCTNNLRNWNRNPNKATRVCTHTHTRPRRQMGQLTGLAGSRVFTQPHLFLQCLNSLGNTQLVHTARLHLPFSPVPFTFFDLVFLNHQLYRPLRLLGQRFNSWPLFFFYLFNQVVLISRCMMLRWISQTKMEAEGNGYMALDHMVVIMVVIIFTQLCLYLPSCICG